MALLDFSFISKSFCENCHNKESNEVSKVVFYYMM